MAALPTTTVAFASSATEADFKTFLSDQRNFLAGLLGTDGLPATARAALGTTALPIRNDGTQMNFIWSGQPNLSYYWGSNDGIAMYPVAGASMAVGYASNCATISGIPYNGLPYVAKDAYGTVGSYYVRLRNEGTAYGVVGNTYSSASIGAPAGTWRLVSTFGFAAGAAVSVSLFQRVA